MAGGGIIQNITPSSTVERPYWELWLVPPGKQYTDYALDNGKVADDFWSRPGRTAEARYYDGLGSADFSRMGFAIGNVPEAGTRPSTYNDPSSQLPSDRVSNVVTRSFPF